MYFKRLIVLLLLSGYYLSAYANQDPRSSAQFYINHFGQIAIEKQPLAGRAQTIFSRLLRIADNARAKAPELILVESNSWPWAIALPDNSVVLTQGALELCYRDVSEKQGDVRLAMLLGHELAHLDEDDYWHRDVYLALADSADSADKQILQFIGERSGLVKSAEWKNIVRDRELKADDRGAIYAALAGYDLAGLFDDDEANFFQYWAANTVNKQSDYYLTAEQRGDYLKNRLTSLMNLPEAYKAGLGLISMGYFEQAEVLYKAILRQFPAYEVYNNLGYLKLAQQSVDKDTNNTSTFWLPLALDLNPSTPILLRGDGESFVASKSLIQSIDYFEQAVERHPVYLTGVLNLSSAYFLARRYQKAAAVIEDAQNRRLSSAQLALMDLMVLYASLKDKVSIEQYVVGQFEQLIEQRPEFLMASFNLAQILELENQPDKAQKYWQSLSEKIEAIPHFYQKIVAEKTKIKLPKQKDLQLKPLKALLQNRMYDTSQANSIIENYGTVKLTRWSGRSQTSYQKIPLMNAINLPKPDLIQVLNQCCQQPLYKQISSLGELWVYPAGITALLGETDKDASLLISHRLQDELLDFINE